MNILYIAYSCAPNSGSEDKIGWNIPLESAKRNNVWIITKEEHRSAIERYLVENETIKMHVHYVDIPAFFKCIFRGFFYSGRLNIWQRNAVKVAREICAYENIQIIHQITPIEFRSIGDYGRFRNVKYVCGPLGAGQTIPKSLLSYTGNKVIIEWLRTLANYWSLCKLKYSKKIQKCDFLLFVNRETRDFLQPVIGEIPNAIYFDNGISE